MNESPLYSRTHDLLLWLLPQVTKFPRVHRFGLGERITMCALDFQGTIIAAGLRKEMKRMELLQTADTQINQLRQLLRLGVDLHILSVRQYEHVSRIVDEIGRLLGAWIRKSG